MSYRAMGPGRGDERRIVDANGTLVGFIRRWYHDEVRQRRRSVNTITLEMKRVGVWYGYSVDKEQIGRMTYRDTFKHACRTSIKAWLLPETWVQYTPRSQAEAQHPRDTPEVSPEA